MRAAQIKDNAVVNFAEVAGFGGEFIDPLDAVIGSVWDGQRFVTTPLVPARVPMLSAQLVMIDEGWFTDVQAFLASIPGMDGAKARAYFDHALTIERAHPLVLGYQQARGKTDAQMDDLFIKAGALNA